MNKNKDISVDPNKKQLEEEVAYKKEMLESKKLELEIAHIKSSWWKKPAYLAAFIPASVAVITIFQILYTGYFENKRTLLNIETLNLVETRKDLENQKSQAEFELEESRKELREKKQLLDLEKKQTETTRSNLEKERLKMEEQLIALREKHKRDIKEESVNTHIETLTKNEDVIYPVRPFHPASQKLIKLIQTNDPSYLKKIIAALDTADNETVKANLLYVLFKGTGDDKWFNYLLNMAHSQPETLDDEFWIVFGLGEWGGKHYLLLEELLNIMSSVDLSYGAKMNIFLEFTSNSECPYCLRGAIKNKDVFFEGIRFARDMALASKLNETERSVAFRALAEMEPRAFFVVGAKVLATEPLNSIVRIRFLEDLEQNIFSGLKEEIGSPPSDKNWSQWQEEHQDSIDIWLEPSLAKAKQQYKYYIKEQEELEVSINQWIAKETVKTQKVITKESLSQLLAYYKKLDLGMVKEDLVKKMETFYLKGDYSGTFDDILFPIHSVTLGRTTVEELDKLGKGEKDEETENYRYYINDIQIWTVNNVADGLYLVSHRCPQRWRLAGMRWNYSYQDWLNLFKKWNWNYEIIKKPTTEKFANEPTFSANVTVTTENYRLIFDFNYSKKTGETTPETLYSVTVENN